MELCEEFADIFGLDIEKRVDDVVDVRGEGDMVESSGCSDN